MAPLLSALAVSAVLRWGGDLQGGEPYVSQDPNDPRHLIGFEVELAEAIAGELGEHAEFVQSDWSTLMHGLERGSYDVALNGVEDTAERRERFALTRPYYRFELVLSTPSDAAAPPARVGVLEGSLAAHVAREQGYETLLYQGVAEPYLDLALRRGRIDAVLMDSVIEATYGRRDGLSVRARLGTGDYVIACREAARCARVDAALERVQKSGAWRAILEKWKLWNEGQRALLQSVAPLEHAQTKRSFALSHLTLFLRAALVTLLVSLAAMALAASWGLLLATVRVFGPRGARVIATMLVEAFRGTPILLQLYVIYFGLAPYLALSPVMAAVLALGLNYGAYEAEIYRGGLSSVPARQWDAGLALGLSRAQTFRHVVLPQAVRVALPGMANDFVSLLKDSALVSVITVVELTKQMQITAVDLRSWLVPGLVCAALYLAMSLPVSWLGRALERRLAT